MEFYDFPFSWEWNVIIPTDELHHFSEGKVYHQPDNMCFLECSFQKTRLEQNYTGFMSYPLKSENPRFSVKKFTHTLQQTSKSYNKYTLSK